MNSKFIKALILIVFIAVGGWYFLGREGTPEPVVYPDGPAWWKVSDEDTTIMITGTIHLTRPELQWLSDERKALVIGADALILELSPEEMDPAKMQPLVMKYGLFTDGRKLEDEIGKELFAKLSEAAGPSLPAFMLNNMKPWFAGLNVSVMKLVEAGYDPESGADQTYQNIAQEAGIPVEGLETAELQISVLSSMEGDDGKATIQLMLDELPKSVEMIDGMTAAWVDHDAAALEAFMNDGMQEYPDMAEVLLYKRNRNWAKQVDELLENRAGTFVIAVGAGHLIGEQSLIDLLEKAGEEVSRF